MLVIKGILALFYLPSVSSFFTAYYYQNTKRLQVHQFQYALTSSYSTVATRLSCASSPLHDEVVQFLYDNKITFEKIPFHNVQVIALGRKNDENKFKLGLHLIPFPHHSWSIDKCMDPKTCKHITDSVKQSPFETIIHLHEDVWRNKHEITKARILAKMNILKNRWYARNTVAERISVTEAMEFLEEHHLWQSTRSKYNYGLFSKKEMNVGDTGSTGSNIGRELLAVATFSPRRHVKRLESDSNTYSSRMYRSHELIRYCAKRDEVIVGGITKLLSRFCQELAPDDIVTCIDRDFGDGDGWLSVGFEKVQVMPPLLMVVEKSNTTETTLLRRYLVGAGVGESVENPNNKKNSRPGIDNETYTALCQSKNAVEGEQILLNNGYWPVYDAGVERRILLIQRTKMKNHVLSKKEELGLDDIVIPEHRTVLDVWNESTPSFPSIYYSPNPGIEFLLQKAAA